jgi:mono/diheme cytochrome c family protein
MVLLIHADVFGGSLNILRLTAAILLCVALAHAQDAKPEGSLTANPVYEKNCAKCHGKTAEGRFMAGPSLLSGKATTMSAETFAPSSRTAGTTCRSSAKSSPRLTSMG